jgi:hypothetical protein
MSQPAPRRLRRPPTSSSKETLLFHVVLVPEQGPASVHSFETPEALADFLSSYQGSVTESYYFRGTRFFTTKGPYRRLLLPGQEPVEIPLPAPEDYDHVSDNGFLGDREFEILASEIVVPPPAVQPEISTNAPLMLPPTSVGSFDINQLVDRS